MTITTTVDPDELNETYKEKNEHKEDEISKFHIMSLQDALAAVKNVGRFISSIEVESSNIFFSTVTLANEFCNEIIQRRDRLG